MSLNSLPVRRIQHDDLTMVVSLWSRAFCHSFPGLTSQFALADFSAKLEVVLVQGHHLWVVVESEQVCGFASIHHRLIRNLFVDPDHQRKGLGSHLLNAMKQEYGKPLFVQTLAAHWWARAFYRKSGFEFFVERPSGFEGLTDAIYRWDG